MNIRKTSLLVCLFFTLAAALQAEIETVKVLGIGNSFTRNATAFLPQVFADSPTEAVVGAAIIGGCSLERHVHHAKEHEADPQTGNEYTFQLNGEKVKGNASLKEMLLAEDWDIITIQQVSAKSFKEETFYPYAGELIDYIRQYRPEAEIVFHETWSHGVNSYRNKEWGLDPADMYAMLHANYAKVAAENGLRVIPVGTAFQNARATDMWGSEPDNFDPKNHELTYPEDQYNLPDMSKSLTWDYYWKKNQKTRQWQIYSDGFHANNNGKYLGGLVWYAFLTGNDPREITFTPDRMSEAKAESLREVAHETAQSQKQAAAAM